MTRRRRTVALIAALALVATAACSGGDDEDASVKDDGGFGDPGDCIVVDLAVSSEKASLMTELAGEFNGSDAADLGDGRCAFAYPRTKASGLAAQRLSEGWDESTDGPLPVVWSPAASSWGAVVNQRLIAGGQEPIVGDADPFMQTPLVIAMPEPMADALGQILQTFLDHETHGADTRRRSGRHRPHIELVANRAGDPLDGKHLVFKTGEGPRGEGQRRSQRPGE